MKFASAAWLGGLLLFAACSGAQGPQGEQGPPGVQGATGATGPAGRDADENLFPDPYFEQDMTFWQLRANGSQGSVATSTTAAAGTKVFTNAANQVAWLSSSRLVPVNAQHTYEVFGSFRRPGTAGSAGGIYLAVRLFDDAKADISGDGDWWYYPVSFVQLTDTNLHFYRAPFGAGTERPLPANARYMSVGAILNYDGSIAGNRIYEVSGLGIQDIRAVAASDTVAYDGSAGVTPGTAQALYTPTQTLGKGTYFVTYYHCLSGCSQTYYVQATAEATAGTIRSGAMNKDCTDLTLFSSIPFVMKVRSATADVRFKVWNPAGGTVSTGVGGCTNFEWTLIGP